MSKDLIKKFNSPDTLGIITSFPVKRGEISRANAISRYSYLLAESFPQNKNVVVFCEKHNSKEVPYLVSKNILVVPSYKTNNVFFFVQILKNILLFTNVKDILIQFEFSIFGGKRIIPGFLTLLAALGVMGKNTSLVLHQVVSDLHSLSGHLGLTKKPFVTLAFNLFLNSFYRVAGLLTGRIIVHDEMLEAKIKMFADSQKIKVIPHAVGDFSSRTVGPKLKNTLKRKYGFSGGDTVVAIYGYQSWYKGTDWIIDAVTSVAQKYPTKKIKLLVAGGKSPTLKNTGAYRDFNRGLVKLINHAKNNVKVTGFISEKDVWEVFNLSDVMVFPYRTRMSVSGAFSLTLSYAKAFLVSKPFSTGLGVNRNLVFNLEKADFENKLIGLLGNPKLRITAINYSKRQCQAKSWKNVAYMYLNEVTGNNVSREYKDAIQKAYSLVQN